MHPPFRKGPLFFTKNTPLISFPACGPRFIDEGGLVTMTTDFRACLYRSDDEYPLVGGVA